MAVDVGVGTIFSLLPRLENGEVRTIESARIILFKQSDSFVPPSLSPVLGKGKKGFSERERDVVEMQAALKSSTNPAAPFSFSVERRGRIVARMGSTLTHLPVGHFQKSGEERLLANSNVPSQPPLVCSKLFQKSVTNRNCYALHR